MLELRCVYCFDIWIQNFLPLMFLFLNNQKGNNFKIFSFVPYPILYYHVVNSSHPTKFRPLIGDTTVQPIRGLVFGGKWLEFSSLSQIKVDYNFSIYVTESGWVMLYLKKNLCIQIYCRTSFLPCSFYFGKPHFKCSVIDTFSRLLLTEKMHV